MNNEDAAAQAVHEALNGYLEDGELAVAWTLTIEIAGPGGRYLAHRAGGGIDGTDAPMVWTVLGMLRAGTLVAEEQVVDWTTDVDDDDDEES